MNPLVRIVLLGAALALGAPSTLSAADDKPAAEANPLEAMARFVGGAWIGEGKGPGGTNDFHTKVAYEWGLNRRLLKLKSFLVRGGAEQPAYETVYFWHPGRRQILFYSISAQGGLFEGTTKANGDTFESQFTSYQGEQATTYRQTVRFVDADHTEWTVHAKKGEEWVKVIESRQRREGGAAAGQ